MSTLPTLYKNNFIKQPIVSNTTFYNSDYLYFISGRVLEKDSRLVNEAIVTLFEAHSMTPVVAMQTYNQGFFRFVGLNPELEYLVVVKDRSGKSDYNAIIYDRVKAKPYSFIDETYLDFSIKPVREVIEYPDVITNEETPQSYLANTFTFRASGAYDTANQALWSTTDVIIQQLVTGANGVFNGTTSQVSTTSVVPSLIFEKDFTLSFFLNIKVVPQGTVVGYPLISSNPTALSNNDFYIMLTKDMKVVLYKNSTALVTSRTVFETNLWYEIALVREDDSRLSLFINGIKEAHADVSGLISFNNNGTCIGYNKLNKPLNGTLQQIRSYNKAIYSRDYGVTQTLIDLQNFNPYLKVAIYFDNEDISDISSSLPLDVNNVSISSVAYNEGVASGYFDGISSYLKILDNSITNLTTLPEFTFEFAFQPENVITVSSGNFPLVSLGQDIHLEVRNNKLFVITNNKEYECIFTPITHTTFNTIRVSRKQGVIGIFINDILQLKFVSDTLTATSILFGKNTTSFYKGWIDSIRFYTNVNYDFNISFRDYDPFKNNILNKFEFTDTYQPVDYTWMSFTTSGTLKAATDKCVEPPQSLYKIGNSSVQTTEQLGSGTKSWTMEGWFCLGPVRSGNFYPLFDNSHSSQTQVSYGNFVAIEAATSKLILYRGSTINGTQMQVYLSERILKVDEWFHFAWEYEEVDKKLRCYLDFELVYELETEKTLGFGNATRIGFTDTNGTDYNFSGWIDSVYFYRGVAKYSTPIDRLWHPWHNSKNLIDLVHTAEYLNSDNRDSEEPIYISEWKENYRNNVAKQTSVDARPLFVKGNTPFQDSILFDGIDDYLVLRNTLNILYDKSGLWGYLVVNFQDISTEVAEKRTLISATQNGNTENHTLIEVFLGDGINVANNKTLYYRTQGYSKAANSNYYISQVISTTMFEEGRWYTIRFMGNYTNRTMKLYVNGSLDASLTNAFRNTNNTIAWNTTDYYFGKTARNDDPAALPFKGYVNSLYIGSSSSTPTEEDFYRYDAYFRERLGIALDTTHAYYNKPLIIGEYEN